MRERVAGRISHANMAALIHCDIIGSPELFVILGTSHYGAGCRYSGYDEELRYAAPRGRGCPNPEREWRVLNCGSTRSHAGPKTRYFRKSPMAIGGALHGTIQVHAISLRRLFTISPKGITVAASGRAGIRPGSTNATKSLSATGRIFIFSDDLKAIAKIGQGLNVAGTKQRLLGWLGFSDPSSMESLRVFTPEGSILHQAAQFERKQTGQKNQHRSRENGQSNHEQCHVTPQVILEFRAP